MNWTTEIPTEVGWYWYEPDGGKRAAVQVLPPCEYDPITRYSFMGTTWQKYASQVKPGRWMKIVEPPEDVT